MTDREERQQKTTKRKKPIPNIDFCNLLVYSFSMAPTILASRRGSHAGGRGAAAEEKD